MLIDSGNHLIAFAVGSEQQCIEQAYNTFSSLLPHPLLVFPASASQSFSNQAFTLLLVSLCVILSGTNLSCGLIAFASCCFVSLPPGSASALVEIVKREGRRGETHLDEVVRADGLSEGVIWFSS